MKKILIASMLLAAQLSWAQYTDINIIKEVQVKNKGVVVSAHPLASEAGAKILKMGGNAYDAVTATQYALAVVYPQAGNIGGGGFLVGVKSNGEKFTLDYRETAPKKASRDMYIDKKGKADTDLSQNGRLAVGIPGSVAGFFATLKYCKLPMEKIIQPAIDLAEKGFAITDKEADMLQMLRMASFENLEKYQQNSTKAVQIMTEAERRAYADRAEYMGDPDFIQDKTSYLISDDYLKGRWKSFSFDKATPSAEVGKIIEQPKESMQTTHISVLDKDGNAASVTTTLNGYYGSKVLVSGAGFFLNNEMDDFSIKPGVPNMFGAVGGEANSIQPNKRMLSSMTPTIILKNGKPYMVVGTPGGTTIPTSVYQSIVNVVDFKLNANTSVNAPKFHHQWLPETITVENNFPESTISELKSKNYVIEKTKYIGKTEMIVLDEKGNIHAVADGRGDDSVAVE